MATDRITKVNNLLRDVVAKIFLEELDIPGEPLVTVMKAEVSRTLEHATIWISVLPMEQDKKVLEYLRHDIYHLQQLVNRQLYMRPVPKIRFEVDTTEANAARIEKLLAEVAEPEENVLD